MRGLKRGLLVGIGLAVVVFLLPDALLGALTVRSGLASVLPATAPPLGTTARLLLAAVALLVGFGLTFWLVRRRRNEWDIDDGSDFAPLPAAEQMVVAPAARAEPLAVAPATTDRELKGRIERLEAALAEQPPGRMTDADTLPNATALDERLSAIEARIATAAGERSASLLATATRARIGSAVAEIRRTLDQA